MNGPLSRIIPSRYWYRLSNLKRAVIGYAKYSQFGEDLVLKKLFADTQNGFYVDVGAHHPKRYSNTHLLFKRGWSGINIDPDPLAIRLFAKARPKDHNLQMGVAKEAGMLKYYRFSDPALNTFREAEAHRWMGKDWVTFLGTTEVPVQSLQMILEKYLDGHTIDVLTVDAEGMGLEVLESNDWNKFAPRVIVVEDDVEEFLTQKGYDLKQTCGLSYIFLRNKNAAKAVFDRN